MIMMDELCLAFMKKNRNETTVDFVLILKITL